ncbi:MAG: two-component regulator propeller domain-containing protein [Agriterribacter sp.]
MKSKIILVLLLLSSVRVISQNTIALPEILNYTKQYYKAGTQNWDICQDKNGLLYFANNEGLLSFDGVYWKQYPLPNKTIVRSVAIAPDNKIYVGGQDELGYFSPNTVGQLVYYSLKDLVPEQDRSFSDVWDIVCTGNQIFFRSNQRIFVLADKKMQVFPADAWSFIGLTHQGIIAQNGNNEISRFLGNKWAPVLKNDVLPAHSIITASIMIGKDTTLLTTLKDGIFIYTDRGITKLSNANLDAIATQYIYNATAITENHIALATTMMGCFVIDKKGNLVQQFSRHEGLQNNNILSIFTDQNKNLWLGLDNGIDFIAYNSAIKNIYPGNQDEGSGYSCIVYHDSLFIATTSGLYYAPLQPQQPDLSFVKGYFKPVINASGQAWNISEVNGKLLMGHHEGAFLVENGKAVPLDKSSGFWTFLPLYAVSPSPVMVAGSYTGIRFYQYDKSHFVNYNFDASFESARFVTIDNDKIWVSHPYKGVYCVSVKDQTTQVKLYDEKYGLTTQGNYIFKIKNRLVVATENGVFEYNVREDKFEPSAYFNQIFGKTIIRYLKEDTKGNIWFVFNKNLGVVDFSTATPRVIYISELNNKMLSGFEQVYPLNEENIFVGGEKGYYHINYEKYKRNHSFIEAQFREVRATGKSDSVLFYGYFKEVNDRQKQEIIPSLNYQFNSFHFEFSSPTYEQQSNVEYSCYLKGYDNRWSDWSNKTEKEYTYLPAGTYHFRVRARNSLGNISDENEYSFIILPPWYESWWAYGIYACLLVWAGIILYRWQKKKFIVQQLRYEETQKRLRALHQLELEKSEKEIVKLKNEKLEAEIQHKNKEMASATMHLVKKGELITRIKDELQHLNKITEDEKYAEALKKIIKTLGEDDKMDADWEHFTVHFDKVHNDFFVALKKKHTDLTPNELKLCAYLRMNLSTKEMAQLMNISVRGVEISRYRLRKKLQIPTETNLFTYLLNFQAEGKGE